MPEDQIEDPNDPTVKYRPIDPEAVDSEPAEEYVNRIQPLLPHFPEDVLINWFYRHHISLGDYAELDYETLRFELRTWKREDIPGVEAMTEGSFFDNFDMILNMPHDSLARMMKSDGTWPRPIILFRNDGDYVCKERPLRKPWHLLEGHKRLSYLITLRDRGIAAPEHDIWEVRKESSE